ncbi:MAG: type IV pilus assembly protein PilQ [Methylophagaceae bacterium]|jgi:type IV pilus assembly protein PilQ
MTSNREMTMFKWQPITGKKQVKNEKMVINYLKAALTFSFVSMMAIISVIATAADLQSVDYSSLSGDKTRLVLTFSEPVDKPNTFSIDNPARVVLDFTDVKNRLDKRTEQINVGVTKSISTVEAGERTRMVINLKQKVPYKIEQDGNTVMVTIDGGIQSKASIDKDHYQVTNIDFRRGEKGEAKLMIELNDHGAAVNIQQERDTVVVDLLGVTLPEKLQRRLDVTDFATPVNVIDSIQKGGNTQFTLSTVGKFEHIAYQTDTMLVIEVKSISEDLNASDRKDEFGYTGEKLSLNFQSIEVRAVLQLLADFTEMNLVTSDTVQGNLTLRLKNVPSDQALDIILKTKGLAMRQNGNVMLIAPASEIAAREKQELAAQNQLIELEPLYSEIIEINFAKATDLATLLASSTEDSSGAGVTGFLSSRGSATVDLRTNSLLLRDTAEQLVQIRKLIDKLDIPVRQVLIESRIVIANNDFSKELGVRFGTSAQSNTLGAGVTGNIESLGVNAGNDRVNPVIPSATNLNVNLPVANPAGVVALALAKLPFGAILELELSAMQAEGKGEVISSPRVITSNQATAIIEQGTEIPYQEASSSGATSVSFKKAVLSLEVTPQITPDDQIIMDLKVNKDQAVFDPRFTVPSIDTKTVETQVLVENGETVVLGGVYEQTKSNGVSRVPFFGDLPYVGFLFKTTKNVDNKQELLIFVTPKIIKDSLNF